MAKREKVKKELTKQYQIKGVLIKMEWIKQEETMKALFGDTFDVKVKYLCQCLQINVKILVWKHMLFMNLQKVFL